MPNQPNRYYPGALGLPVVQVSCLFECIFFILGYAEYRIILSNMISHVSYVLYTNEDPLFVQSGGF